MKHKHTLKRQILSPYSSVLDVGFGIRIDDERALHEKVERRHMAARVLSVPDACSGLYS